MEPANCKFALLLARKCVGARQQVTPMLAQNLQTAIGPSVALLLVGLECVGQQAVSVAPVGVMNLPAMLEHQQTEIAVFDDCIARPSAGRDHRRAADQAHSAMPDDSVRPCAPNHP